MNKEEQIKEIGSLIDQDCGPCKECKYKNELPILCSISLSAERIYNAGYRKIKNGEIKLDKKGILKKR